MPQGYDFGRGGTRVERNDRTALLEPHERRSVSLTQENTNNPPPRGSNTETAHSTAPKGYASVAPSESGDEDIEVFPPPKSGASSDDGVAANADGPFELSSNGVPSGHEAHLATVAEKRALWWRNVLITTMFILGW